MNPKRIDLNLFLLMQRKFQNKFNFHPPLKDIASAILHEGGELWEASEGKWWSKKKHSRKHKLEELVDILHFWLVYCIEYGFMAEEIFDAYASKLAENYKRQRNDY